MLQVRNNLIGMLAYAVYKLQSPASCAEGTFPGKVLASHGLQPQPGAD